MISGTQAQGLLISLSLREKDPRNPVAESLSTQRSAWSYWGVGGFSEHSVTVQLPRPLSQQARESACIQLRAKTWSIFKVCGRLTSYASWLLNGTYPLNESRSTVWALAKLCRMDYSDLYVKGWEFYVSCVAGLIPNHMHCYFQWVISH